VGNIALQARKLGLTVPLLGGDGWDSSKLGEIAGKAMDGCYYANHASFQDSRPEMRRFVATYQEKHGQTPDALAALGYDSAKLLFDAIQRAPSLAGKDLAAAISQTRGFKGATGTISINQDRNADKSAVVMTLKDGKPVYVTTIEPPK
jgi:branched-chain amino acid transport system substrate-binding protein